MARKSLSAKERVRLFELHKGICHICKQKIQVGEAWELDHVIPVAMFADPQDAETDKNRHPAHKKCHRKKTDDDVADIAKVKRIRAKHTGAWPKSKARIQSRGFQKTRDW